MAYSINPFLSTTDSNSSMIRFGCQALLQHFLKKLYFLHFMLDKSKKHWYNKFIPHDCGKDGLKLSKKFLSSVEKNLKKKGTIIMPVISISDHKFIIKIIEKKFKPKLLISKEWPAPKNLIKGKVENFLKKDYMYKRFNMYLCFTKVYKIQLKD